MCARGRSGALSHLGDTFPTKLPNLSPDRGPSHPSPILESSSPSRVAPSYTHTLLDSHTSTHRHSSYLKGGVKHLDGFPDRVGPHMTSIPSL